MKRKLLVFLLVLLSTFAFARGGGGGGHGGGHGSSHGSEGGHGSPGWHEEEPQPPGRPSHFYHAGHVNNASDTDETGGDSFWHNVVIGLLAVLSALAIVIILLR